MNTQFDYQDYYSHISSLFNEIRLDRDTEIELFRTIIESFLPQKGNVLDIGCGSGRYANYLSKSGYKITALDKNIELLNLVEKDVIAQHGNAINLPFQDSIFDCTYFIMVLHQLKISEQKKAISESFRVLKNNGFLIIKTCSSVDLESRPFNKVFPSSIPINRRRFIELDHLKNIIESLSFKIIDCKQIITYSSLKSIDLIKSIELKHNSTLALLSKKEFMNGLSLLKIALNNVNEITIPHPHTYLIAIKE